MLKTLASLAFVASLAVAVPVVAYAEDPATAAARMQAEEEMKKLAQKNAWPGVEAKFQVLLGLKTDLPYDDWFLGAQAARNLGKTWEMYQRLEQAQKLKPSEDIQREMDGIDAAYGRLKITGNPRKHPTLSAVAMPFAPDERKSVEYAMDYVLNTGSFEGMLPFGDYYYGSLKITVAAGKDFQAIDGTKVKGGPPTGEVPVENPDNPQNPDNPNPNPNPGEGYGAIAYAGPIAVLGPSFLSSGEPATGDDVKNLQPTSMAGVGTSIEVGAEIGPFPGFGVAGQAGFRNLFGSRNLTGFDLWLSACIRPTDRVRIAVGPTWGAYFGKGTGVADWWDVGQNDLQYPAEGIAYRGYSKVGGARLTAGYGVLTIGEHMMGLVEVGGSFQSDGARTYTGGLLRIGIVPYREKYKG